MTDLARHRIRAPLWSGLTPILPAVAVLVQQALVLDPSSWLMLTWLVAFALVVALRLRFGITLTPSHAVVNNLRRRRIPWSEVQAVTTDSFLGSWRTVIWTSTQRVPLRAPLTAVGGLGLVRFERDFHAIGQWWLAHRGADWQPAATSANPRAVRG